MLMESFDEWLLYLQEKEVPILVEGKSDKEALEYHCIKNIITVAQQPLYKVMEQMTAKEIIILTDLDAEGKKLFAHIYRYCQRQGIRVHTKPREFLFKHTTLTHIEGLPHHLRTNNFEKGIKNGIFNAARFKRGP